MLYNHVKMDEIYSLFELFQKPAYSFTYEVRDEKYGANFGHQETRDGHTTQGQYYVQLPDGRTQKVQYTADEHGYRAEVTYEGEANNLDQSYGHNDLDHQQQHGQGGYVAPKISHHEEQNGYKTSFDNTHLSDDDYDEPLNHHHVTQKGYGRNVARHRDIDNYHEPSPGQHPQTRYKEPEDSYETNRNTHYGTESNYKGATYTPSYESPKLEYGIPHN